MKSFLATHGWSVWVVQSYDDWVLGPKSPIRSTFMNLPPAKTQDGHLVSISDPEIRPSPETPSHCRTHRTTYTNEIWCSVSMDTTKKHSKICIGKFPRMVHESAMEGGYFIIDGTERVFVNRESMRYDTPRFRHTPSKSKHIWNVDLTSLDAPFSLSYNSNSGEIKAHIGFASNPVVLDVWTLLRALGETQPPQRVWEYQTTHKDAAHILYKACLSEEEDPMYQVGKALMKSTTDGSVSSKRTKLYASDILHARVLPFLQDDEKVQYLETVILNLAEFALGLRDQTDVDAMEHKRIDTAGKFVARLVCSHLRDMWYRTSRILLQKPMDKDMERFFDVDHVLQGVCKGMKSSTDPDEKSASVLPRKASWQEALATVRRVNADVGASSFIPGPRMFHGTWYGFYCACETPEGARTGLTRDTAVFFKCSPHGDPEAWRDGLRSLSRAADGVRVFVNQSRCAGLPFVESVAMKWCSAFKREQDPYAGIAAIRDPIMFVTTAEPQKWHEAIRESIKLISNTPPELPGTAKIYVNDVLCVEGVDRYKSRKWCFSFRKLNSPDSEVNDAPVREIRIDVSEGRALRPVWTPVAKIDLEFEGEFPELIKAGRVEWIDASQANTIFVSTSAQEEGTHMELDPTSLFGPSAANVPFADHNPGARNLFAAHVRHQAIGFAHPFAKRTPAGTHDRFDSEESHRLWHTQRALCDTKIAREMMSHVYPNGWNAVIFILAKPWGQEDSMGISKRHVDFGAGVVESEISMEESVKFPDEWFGTVDITKHPKLDVDGLPKVGELFFPEDVLVCKRDAVRETSTIKWTKKHPARVAAVARVKNNLVHIRMRWRRTPEVGDKLATRHGQKGVINFLVLDTQTYWTKDGITPDLIMNPAAFPSRMTIGHVFEMLCGKANSLKPPPGFTEKGCEGTITDCTPYSTSFDFAGVQDVLLKHGFQPKGHEIVYNGTTGEVMKDCHVFVGPAFVQRLVHMSAPKSYARGRGVRNPQTGQPPKGRRNEGGLRLGEGEKLCLHAHGGASAQQAEFLECSDGISVMVCPRCHEVGSGSSCAMCGAFPCYQKTVPRTFMLLRDQLRVARVNSNIT